MVNTRTPRCAHLSRHLSSDSDARPSGAVNSLRCTIKIDTRLIFACVAHSKWNTTLVRLSPRSTSFGRPDHVNHHLLRAVLLLLRNVLFLQIVFFWEFMTFAVWNVWNVYFKYEHTTNIVAHTPDTQVGRQLRSASTHATRLSGRKWIFCWLL